MIYIIMIIPFGELVYEIVDHKFIIQATKFLFIAEVCFSKNSSKPFFGCDIKDFLKKNAFMQEYYRKWFRYFQ